MPNVGRERTPAANGVAVNNDQEGIPSDQKHQPTQAPPKRPKRKLKLTASQRERKRAIDREAQRSIRVKTKNYIAHLENLVRIMEKGGTDSREGGADKNGQGHAPNGQSEERARELLSQLRQSQEEVGRFREMVSGVQRLIGGALDSAPEAEPKRLTFSGLATNGPSVQPAFQRGLQETSSQIENCASVYSHSSGSSSALVEYGYCPPQSKQPKAAADAAQGHPSMSVGSQVQPLSQHDRFDACERLFSAQGVTERQPSTERPDVPQGRVEGELFFFSEREINRVLAESHGYFANQPFDEDIIVRAVLHGWRDVQDQYVLDSGWHALKRIDQVVFGECGIVERMAILRTMRLKLLHQGHRGPRSLTSLPSFHCRGPTEDVEALEKIPIIEHFVWPGFRINLCNNARKYINNKFSDAFRHSFKFLWPYDISDLYVRDPVAQLYSTAPEFIQRQSDLRSWTMRKEFFEGLPELFAAIPVYDTPLDRALVPTGSMSTQMGMNTDLDHGRNHQQVPTGRVEEQEVEDSQLESLPPPQSAVPVDGTVGDVPVSVMPQSSEIEAWLGDPDMRPNLRQCWNMASGMNVGYSSLWAGLSRGFVD
ncbi:uncharacterized protein Z518_01493 [Rhinocladiella mackenziei CBS 650.93]|uniref:BZIP domain-containing protein n=1 Tax=Rhinocladiella mackenziei CBS 650.93 TaxID=1442369 RepID=A0A0D2J3X3_9EURO|nr:uncharacterized protein Z518_01493 [Rhinocladiella mackenziei CBS 650.93]KIX10411.1 hypothetical protein Z518_01493 [Rhinocladiella mackenziei CBS 650.93]